MSGKLEMRSWVEEAKRVCKKARGFHTSFTRVCIVVERLFVLHERRIRPATQNAWPSTVKRFMRSLLSLLGTVSLVSTCSTQQKPRPFYCFHSERAAFVGLSERVRPVIIMLQLACPVNLE